MRQRKLVERPPWNLDDTVIQRGLESGDRSPGHLIGDLVESAAQGDLRRHARDRVPRRFRGQGGAAADTGIHFDDVIGEAVGIKRELDIAPALDA